MTLNLEQLRSGLLALLACLTAFLVGFWTFSRSPSTERPPITPAAHSGTGKAIPIPNAEEEPQGSVIPIPPAEDDERPKIKAAQ